MGRCRVGHVLHRIAGAAGEGFDVGCPEIVGHRQALSEIDQGDTTGCKAFDDDALSQQAQAVAQP